MNLDYYYKDEKIGQFHFFRMPRILMKEDHFKQLSSDAKLLYTLMLDRMTLSMKNGWIDSEDRVYIYYTTNEIMQELGCSANTCTKILCELDSKKGIGLIERKRQGQGKPDRIYVKNLIEETKEIPSEKADHKKEKTNKMFSKGVERKKENREEMFFKTEKTFFKETEAKTNIEETFYKEVETKTTIAEPYSQEIATKQEIKERNTVANRVANSAYTTQKNVFETIQGQTMPILKSQKSHFQKHKNQGSSFKENHILETQKVRPNKNDINYNKSNHNKSIYPIYLYEQADYWEEMDKIENYKQLIRKNIEYDFLLKYSNYGTKEQIEELYQLICDVVCVPRKTIRIGGADTFYELVKSQFLKLNTSHIEYVLEKLRQNASHIVNIKSYLLTALYNAPMTITHYFDQRVQYDMYERYC